MFKLMVRFPSQPKMPVPPVMKLKYSTIGMNNTTGSTVVISVMKQSRKISLSNSHYLLECWHCLPLGYGIS